MRVTAWQMYKLLRNNAAGMRAVMREDIARAGSADPAVANNVYDGRPYESRLVNVPPRTRAVLTLLSRVLMAGALAIVVAISLWIYTAQHVIATNESCTPQPPRCVAGWDRDGRHHTAEIGTSHMKGMRHNLNTGRTNTLLVHGGTVAEVPLSLVALMFGMAFASIPLRALARPVRRGAKLRRGRRVPGPFPGD